MITMQVGSYFPNMTNKVKKKKCGPCISYEIFMLDIDMWCDMSSMYHQGDFVCCDSQPLDADNDFETKLNH